MNMKVIGFSSGGAGHNCNADRMVRAILEKSGHETEFVKLTDLKYSACKGCVELCAGPRVCRLEDELLPYYQKIKEAGAVVLGSPVYFRSINATMGSFIERFFGYRHVKTAIEDKPFVTVVVGHTRVDEGTAEFLKALRPFRVSILDTVTYRSVVHPCYRCGHHSECHLGGLYRRLGEAALSLEITPDLFRRWEDEAQTVTAVDQAANKLRRI